MTLARKAVPLALTAIAAAGLPAAGCGSDSRDGIETRSPERTFAPLVQLSPDERSLPIGARWFLERSVLWFADDQGCADRKIAVGRELEEQQNAVVDWLYVYGLGTGAGPTTRIAAWVATTGCTRISTRAPTTTPAAWRACGLPRATTST